MVFCFPESTTILANLWHAQFCSDRIPPFWMLQSVFLIVVPLVPLVPLWLFRLETARVALVVRKNPLLRAAWFLGMQARLLKTLQSVLLGWFLCMQVQSLKTIEWV